MQRIYFINWDPSYIPTPTLLSWLWHRGPPLARKYWHWPTIQKVLNLVVVSLIHVMKCFISVRTVIHEVSTSLAWEPGVPVTFSCRATSDDITPVTHTWFHNDQQLVYDSNVMFDPIQQVLHITTANDEDQGLGRAGTYRCQVTNGYSQATLEHFLTAPSGCNLTLSSFDFLWFRIKHVSKCCLRCYASLRVVC